MLRSDHGNPALHQKVVQTDRSGLVLATPTCVALIGEEFAVPGSSEV